MSKALSTRNVALACFAIALIAGYALFGLTGIGVLFAFALFLVLPQYAVLRNFGIEEDEKWFFSLFIGLGLFSTAVWFVGRFMPLKAALITTLVLFAIASYALSKVKKKQVSSSAQQ
jgi:hypothetical protein